MASTSAISSFTYSKRTYPGRGAVSSAFPWPHRCTTSKVFSNSSSAASTASFTALAPVLPPTASRIGFWPDRPVKARPFSRLPRNRADRMGVPVWTPLPAGTFATVSRKVVQTVSANLDAIRLARPGV